MRGAAFVVLRNTIAGNFDFDYGAHRFFSDLIEGLVRLMATPPEFTGPVNLGTPQEYTMRELAEEVIRLTNSRSRIVSAPLPSDDPRQRRPDITLAQQTLGWQPSVSLRDGLRKTIEYFSTIVPASNG